MMVMSSPDHRRSSSDDRQSQGEVEDMRLSLGRLEALADLSPEMRAAVEQELPQLIERLIVRHRP
jgi:hypothetical protein